VSTQESQLTPEELVARIERLASRVQELEDRIAIRELTARHNNTFDDVDTEAYVNCFTEGGEFEHDRGGPVTSGREHLASMSRAVGYGPVHMTMDPIIEIDGDRAVQTCTMTLGARTKERTPGSATYVTSARYRDELVRTDEGWKFAKRQWVPDAILDNLPEW